MPRAPLLTSLAGAGLLAVLAAPGAVARTPIPVQPGMAVEVTGVATCTGGFVFDGVGRLAGRVYLGLAAHCTEGELGAVVTDAAGNRFGSVAFSRWPYRTFADDFAFVQIDRAAYARVDPAMAGHPTLPTGVVPPGGAAAGDRVQLSGWGSLTDGSPTTREQRVTVLKDHSRDFWSGWGVMSPGDSGGPVAHLPSGGALGSVSNLCLPFPVDHSSGFEQVAGCLGYGPSMAGILTRAAAAGFPVRLRSAAQGRPR